PAITTSVRPSSLQISRTRLSASVAEIFVLPIAKRLLTPRPRRRWVTALVSACVRGCTRCAASSRWKAPTSARRSAAPAFDSRGFRKPSLVKTEIHFDVYLHCDRAPVFHARRKFPTSHCFQSLFIQPHAERARHVDVADVSCRINDQRQYHVALEFCAACFIRIFRVRAVDGPRRTHPVPHAESISTNAAVKAWPNAGAFPRADAGSSVIANAAPAAGSIRRDDDVGRDKVANLVRLRKLEIGGPEHGRWRRELRDLAMHHHWRCQLLIRKFRRSPAARLHGAVIAATTTAMRNFGAW